MRENGGGGGERVRVEVWLEQHSNSRLSSARAACLDGDALCILLPDGSALPSCTRHGGWRGV